MPSDPGSRLALVVARAGSKGLPGKNLAKVGPHSLIGWSVLVAQQASSVDRIVLSTDSAEMAEEGRRYGAEVPFLRPPDLAGDAASPVDVALHLLDWFEQEQDYRPDWLLLLQPTSPLRVAADLDQAWQAAKSVQAPAAISVAEPAHHPMHAQTLDSEGRLQALFPGPARRRQDLPPVYMPNGAVYWIKAQALRAERTFYPAGALGYVMPPERSIDIDTAHDLLLARAHWSHGEDTRSGAAGFTDSEPAPTTSSR